MLLRTLFLCALPLINTQKTEKVTVDGDTTKEPELSNFEFIPKDQLCLLCHSVITKFQQASNKNPAQFKNVSFK
jgi:hypothetical protein